MKRASLLEFELAIEQFVADEAKQEELIELCTSEFEKEPRPALHCANMLRARGHHDIVNYVMSE